MDKQTLAKILMNKYGQNAQLFKTLTELIELSHEITQFLEGKQNSATFITEIADVEIVLESVKLIFNTEHYEHVLSTKIKKVEEKYL